MSIYSIWETCVKNILVPGIEPPAYADGKPIEPGAVKVKEFQAGSWGEACRARSDHYGWCASEEPQANSVTDLPMSVRCVKQPNGRFALFVDRFGDTNLTESEALELLGVDEEMGPEAARLEVQRAIDDEPFRAADGLGRYRECLAHQRDAWRESESDTAKEDALMSDPPPEDDD